MLLDFFFCMLNVCKKPISDFLSPFHIVWLMAILALELKEELLTYQINKLTNQSRVRWCLQKEEPK